MTVRLATIVALVACALPLHAEGRPALRDRALPRATFTPRAPSRAPLLIPLPADVRRRLSSNTTGVSDVMVTTVRRISNTATLSSVAETGLQVAREAGTQPHIRRARKATRALRYAARGGRAMGSTHRTLRTVGRLGRKLAPLTRAVNTVFGVSSFGLMLDAGHRLHKATTKGDRLDAARDLGAGVSGLGRLGFVMRSVSQRLGVVGGCLQAGVGLTNIYRGVTEGSRDLLVSGSLDLCGGGLLVLGSCAIGDPYVSFGAAAFTAGRMIYDGRDAIRAAAIKGLSACRRTLCQLGAEVGYRAGRLLGAPARPRPPPPPGVDR